MGEEGRAVAGGGKAEEAAGEGDEGEDGEEEGLREGSYDLHTAHALQARLLGRL